MPKISFDLKKSHLSYKEIQVNLNSNLMKSLLDSGLPVASSCNGDGVCGKCKMTILQGQKYLTEATELEKEIMLKNNYQTNQRVSCLVKVLGDIQVDAPYW